MAQFTLTDGAFGRGSAAADLSALHLPDPGRPGVLLVVPFHEVAEMVMVGSDNDERFKTAIRRGVTGLLSMGPAGIAVGIAAVGKAPATIFTVRLEDGRQFTARAGAAIFAEMHAAQIEARASTGSHPADAVIAKYLAGVPAEPRSVPAALPIPPEPKSEEPQPLLPGPLSPRPFGRRGL